MPRDYFFGPVLIGLGLLAFYLSAHPNTRVERGFVYFNAFIRRHRALDQQPRRGEHPANHTERVWMRVFGAVLMALGGFLTWTG